MPDDQLSVAIQHADGRVSRWGPDEIDGKNIPNDLSFSSSIPGGFQDMSCSLLRRIDQDYPDQGLFDTVTVYGAGNRIAWQGRMQQFPRSHGASYQITPGAVGWAAHLRDDASFREIYVDRSYQSWTGATVQHTLNLLGTGWHPIAPEIAPDPVSGQPSMVFNIVGAWDTTGKPHGVARYSSPGLPLGSLYFGWKIGASITTGITGSWGADGLLGADDIDTGGTYDQTPVSGAGPGTATVTATGTRYYGRLAAWYGTGPAGGAGNLYPFFVTCVAMYGTHGLTKRGTASTTDAQGFYASDVIPHILARAAPLLKYTTGTGGSVEPTSFVIPHLAFRDPTAAEDAIAAVNAYHLYDWGVYDNREFFYRQPDPARLTWEARLGDGAFMDADGLTGEQVINGVFVTYTDAAGDTKTVGPPGLGSGFDATSSLLVDTSDANPVNAAGIPRKWTPLTLSVPTNQEGAQTIGAAYLAERSLATRRGSMTLTGTVAHPTEGQVPVWRVRAGDWVRVADLNGDNADVPRKIISTSYSHQSRSISLSLDNTVAKLDAILARVGIQAGVTTGGGF